MSTEQAVPAVAAQDQARIDDHDGIAAALQLYMDGAARGDSDKLRQAFHPDARMFGSAGGSRVDMPIEGFFELADQGAADVEGSYRGRILSIDQIGDAACAAVAEDGYWGQVSFVDFFTLTKIDGEWKIVNKTFAHTGGELPAG